MPPVAWLGVLLAGCSPAGSSSATGPATPVTSAPAATAAPTVTAPSPPPTPPAHTGLGSCPSPRRAAALTVIAHPPVSPDDLLALPDGTIWATDPVGGALVHLGAHGELLQRVNDAAAPEGMVALPGGRLLLAEQRRGRLVILGSSDPAGPAFLTLPSSGSALGVDGLGVDPVGDRVLVPDSPHGTLLAVPTGGGPASVIARGLGRDVGVTMGPDGNIWVAVEGSTGLYRVPPGGGTPEPVGSLSQLDDIVTDGRLLYATLLRGGQVVAIDPVSGAHAVLVTGIGSAQGLAVLADGRLAVADSNSGDISALEPCP